jgi:outer membrane protein TolC
MMVANYCNLIAVIPWFFAASCSLAQQGLLPAPTNQSAAESTPLDIVTVLRLAGARNLDVEFARLKLIEAEGAYASERLRFLPAIHPGIAYRRHDGRTQSTEGDLIDVSKQSYQPGIGLVAELNIGETIYRNLAALRTVEARRYAIDRRSVESMYAASIAFYDVALADALQAAAGDALRLTEDQEQQLKSAVDAGIALRSDVLRISVQKERNNLIVREAAQLGAIARTRLAEALHIDPTIRLHPKPGALSSLELMEIRADNAAALTKRAAQSHPATKEARELIAAAEKSRDGSVYGPFVPTIRAQAFTGGLGGGRGSDLDNFGDQHEFGIGLSWTIGAGGLFDKGRKQTAEARLAQARVSASKVKEELAQMVAEAHAVALSSKDRIQTAERALATAAEVVRLANERKEFGVGVVLEMIQAGIELNHTRRDYLQSNADYNKAQVALSIYTGRLGK